MVLPLAIVGEGVGSNGRGVEDAFALSPHAGCPIPLAASRYCKQGQQNCTDTKTARLNAHGHRLLFGGLGAVSTGSFESRFPSCPQGI